MSHLHQELDRYLTIRRSLGYDLGTAERMLKRFIAFAETEGTEHVSADLFLRWQMAFGNANRQTWTARFGVVRRFAEWLHGLDPSHEIIPHGLIPSRAGRSRPYIYQDAEIAHIINAAAELPSTYGLRGSTMSTLFGLIAVTGLRINEALALNSDDVDIEQGKHRYASPPLSRLPALWGMDFISFSDPPRRGAIQTAPTHPMSLDANSRAIVTP
jgi:integrase